MASMQNQADHFRTPAITCAEAEKAFHDKPAADYFMDLLWHKPDLHRAIELQPNVTHVAGTLSQSGSQLVNGLLVYFAVVCKAVKKRVSLQACVMPCIMSRVSTKK